MKTHVRIISLMYAIAVAAAAGADDGKPLTSQQGDEILKELREIVSG